MSKLPKIALLIVGAGIAAAIIYAGVSTLIGGSGSSGDAASTRSAVERLIGRQLPKKLERVQESRVRTRGLTCTEVGAERFRCDARMQPAGASGDSEILDLTLAASCGESGCGWHTVKKSISNSASSDRTTSPGRSRPSGSMAEPEYGWSTMTCGEVVKAVRLEDAEWLGSAGQAVAYKAIASLPDGDEEELAVEGGEAVLAVCAKASNSGYQPFEMAEAKLIGRLERQGS
jgi:hypothetical protein